MIPQNTDESELDTSGDSGRGEHAHQMSPNNVYRDGSLIPNKGGELIAAIHQCILLKVLRKLMNKNPIKLPLVGNGFYICRCQVRLNGTAMVISICGTAIALIATAVFQI